MVGRGVADQYVCKRYLLEQVSIVQKKSPFSFRDACMDVGGRAATVGALGDAGSQSRDGQDEGHK